jgi:cytoskeletal protein CcmA (bactofilin family)
MREPNFDTEDALHTIVGASSVFRGDVEFTGSMRVEGSVIGGVSGVPGGASRLWLDEGGSIIGDVHVTDALIDGRVTGNVYCMGYLELGASAFIKGDVHYAYLEMHIGATVAGHLVRETTTLAEGKVVPLKSVVQQVPRNSTDGIGD